MLRRRIALLILTLTAGAADAPSWPSILPRYDHIVIVLEENKDYDQIIGNTAAPYLNKLVSEGATLTRMFGEEHPSQVKARIASDMVEIALPPRQSASDYKGPKVPSQRFVHDTN